MIKHRFFTYIFAVTVSISQIHAETFKLSGTIVSEEYIPLEYANVILRSNSSNEIIGTTTEHDGRFEIKTTCNNYTLSVNFLGHETYFSEITLDKDIDIGIIQLKLDTQFLQEVTIFAPRKLFERKVDRLVFNIENSIISTGGDILDALRVIPGLRVMNDQISMVAKSNMIVTVDDIIIPLSSESLVNYLKSIPTASIKNIEIITNPPAKYDAEGNSGIINIVLKKPLYDSWNLNLRGVYTQQTYPDGNVGTDFNYKKNKLSLFANINTGAGKDLMQMENNIYYIDETWKTTSPLRRTYNFLGANAGVNYQISKSWKIGAIFFGHWSYNPHRIDNINTTVFDSENLIKKVLLSTKESNRSSKTRAFNFNSITNLDSLGKKLSIDIDYFYNNPRDSFGISGIAYNQDLSQITNSFYANKNRNTSIITNSSAKIDLELPLKIIHINIGGKISFTEVNNDYILYDNTSENLIVDNNQSNVFRYNENIQALYISVTEQLTKKIYIKAGVRMENSATEGFSKTINQADQNNYFKLFPSTYLLYRLNDDRSIALNYSRRINRPFFYELNPYKVYDNEYSYSEGNPFLLPSFSQNLELSLTIPNSEHKLWYSYISNDRIQFPFVDPITQIVRNYPINCLNYYSVGFSESYNFNKIWWWNSYNSGTLYYIHKATTLMEAIPSIHTISSNFSTNNDFLLNRKRTLMLNAGFYYEFPYLFAYNKVDAYNYVYVGMRARLLKDNLTIALTFNDVFKTNHAKQTIQSNGIKYVYNNLPDSRYFRFSISYKFGNNQVWTERRTVGNEDERGRVR